MNAHAPVTKRPTWLDMAERGSLLGLRTLALMCILLGRTLTRLSLTVVVLYYALTHRAAMAHSRRYLRHVGRPHGFWSGFRHLLRFAQVNLDRLYWLKGKTSAFDVQVDGREQLVALRAQGVGALMLGSHVGSFEAMRALGDAKRFPVHVVAHFDNSQKLHQVLGENVGARIIAPDAGDMSFVLKLREVIDRGELVAILADRYLEGNRTIVVDVLGRPAHLPVGPYLVAAALKCPVYVCFALHTGHARYAVAVEKLADRIELPRRARDEALRGYVQQYADKLSEYARKAPDNWFNFYDFWESEH